MVMNYSRFQSTLKGQTTQAQRVYDAVPASTGWSYNEINSEIARSGNNMEYRILQGCIAALVRAALVREVRLPVGHGEARHPTLFMREAVRGRPVKPLDIQDSEPINNEEEEMSLPTSTATTRTPTDTLADLAQRARAMMATLSALATEIDDAALATQAYIEQGDAGSKKLRQLQALLKDMT